MKRKIRNSCFIAGAILLFIAGLIKVYERPSKTEEIKVPNQATVYTSTKGTDLRISEVGTLTAIEARQQLETECFVYIDPTHTFQTMVGIGGAITDASAEVFAKLPAEKQQEFLNAYYNKETGIGYSLIRTPVHSCDFSSESYTYVADNDSSLSTFNIEHDEKYKLPLIKEALKLAGKETPLYVSPWSPPAWMKDNNNMLHGGKLLLEYAQSWANYNVKYIQELEKRDIPVWGLSVQNEPMAVQIWESCIYTAEEERDFVKNNLGPALHANNMKDKKLIVWDHNRDLIFHRASVILNDPEAAKYVWGVGFHWYETWTGSPMNFNALRMTKNTFPDKELIFTEGCAEGFSTEKINEWYLGEKYGNSMINDFNAGTAAWTDWNILLDERGGPNHVGNFCFAPVHADTNTGDIIYTSAYYYIGHFSKFIQPGAKRLSGYSSREQLLSTSFMNPDGSIVVVVMNQLDEGMGYNLIVGDKQFAYGIAPHSISTFVLK